MNFKWLHIFYLSLFSLSCGWAATAKKVPFIKEKNSCDIVMSDLVEKFEFRDISSINEPVYDWKERSKHQGCIWEGKSVKNFEAATSFENKLAEQGWEEYHAADGEGHMRAFRNGRQVCSVSIPGRPFDDDGKSANESFYQQFTVTCFDKE